MIFQPSVFERSRNYDPLRFEDPVIVISQPSVFERSRNYDLLQFKDPVIRIFCGSKILLLQFFQNALFFKGLIGLHVATGGFETAPNLLLPNHHLSPRSY